MDTLRGFDVIDYAIKKDVDYIALVVSPWHMIGVQAVLEKLTEEHRDMHGIIVICKNGNRKYTINPDMYGSMQGAEFVYYESEIKKDFRIWKAMDLRVKGDQNIKVKKFFLIPHKIDIFLYAYYANKLVGQILGCYILDEGLGTYIGLNGSDYDKKNGFLTLFVQRLVDGIAKKYTNRLIRSNRWNNFSVLKSNDCNGWVNNEQSIQYYSKALNKIDIQDEEANQMYSNAIVINTQPFMGVGIPEENVDIDILLELCRKCKDKGLNIVIKPHPGQNDLERYARLQEYVFWDLRKGFSQEAILNSLKKKPKAVVAFSSTTLLTTKLFYGIPSYSLAKILLKENINSFHKERLNAFINTFENQICFYDSISQILDEMATNQMI